MAGHYDKVREREVDDYMTTDPLWESKVRRHRGERGWLLDPAHSAAAKFAVETLDPGCPSAKT